MRYLCALFTLCACGQADPFPILEDTATTEDALVETSHKAHVTVSAGVARYRVTRTFHNPYDQITSAEINVPLPAGGTAVGFRVFAQGSWFDAAFSSAEDAQEEYDQLTMEGLTDPLLVARRDPARPVALLSLFDDGELSLQAYPVRPGQEITFFYEIVAPTCYVDGSIQLEYITAEDSDYELTVDSSIYGDVSIHEVEEDEEEAFDITAWDTEEHCLDNLHRGDGETALIDVEPAPIDLLAGRLSTFDFDDGRQLVHLEIDTAQMIEELPNNAQLVFVLDGSYSTEDEQLKDQLALVQAYLSHVPDATLQIVVVRRVAERLFERFVPANEFIDELAALPDEAFELRNGSNLDEGLALAASLLSGTTQPARLVSFTDARLKDAFSVEETISLVQDLPEQAVLHLVLREEKNGSLWEERDDDHALAPIALDHGGILLRLNGDVPNEEILGLVRPIRIDNLTITSANDFPFGHPDLLDEKQGLRDLLLLEEPIYSVQIAGSIWGRKWSQTIYPDPDRSPLVAAFTLGSNLQYELEDDDLRELAETTGAVSRVTSYLAIDQERAPEYLELRPALLNTMSFCMGGVSTGCSCGFGVGHGVSPSFSDRISLLRTMIAEGVRACTDRIVSVEIEATGDEIVDVRVEGEADPAATSCIEEIVWKLRLTDFFDYSHATYTVSDLNLD